MLLSVLLIVALALIPVAWVQGSQNAEAEPFAERPVSTTTSTVTSEVTKTASKKSYSEGSEESGAGGADDSVVDFVENATGSQATFVRLSDGEHIGTATERFARPALSLIKLYMAEYVLEHGDKEDRYDAIKMISDSNDRTAEELYDKYPESIDHVADEYNLISTRGAKRWGESTTSTYDVVQFIAALLEKDPSHPILVAMTLADEVAADGYDQNFGTTVLPGVIGTKWAWSDDRSLHSSVSFGEGWVAAAAVTGSAEDLTEFVEAQIEEAASDD